MSFEGEGFLLALVKFASRDARGARRVALTKSGAPCASGLLTEDGALIPNGGVAAAYLDERGDWVDRKDLSRAECDAALPPTIDTVHELEGAVPPEMLLDGVASHVYVAVADAMPGRLERALKAGEIFRFAFRPRASTSAGDTYLFANDSGVFAISTAPVAFDFVDRSHAPVFELADATNDSDFDSWEDFDEEDFAA
jgi:hypothetical protein